MTSITIDDRVLRTDYRAGDFEDHWAVLAPTHVDDQWAAVGNFDRFGLDTILEHITALASGDERDEYGVLRPTEYALCQTTELLRDASRRGETYRFPDASVTTDEEGGVRIEWLHNDRAVHLVVPATNEGQSYLYHEDGDDYGIVKPMTASVLAHWLRLVI